MAAPFIPSLIQPIDPAAVANQLADWQTNHPNATLLALLPEAEVACVPGLQAECCDRHLSLVGAIFPALLTEQGFSTEGLLLLCLPETPARLIPDLATQPDPAQTISDEVQALLKPLAHTNPNTPEISNSPPTLFMLFDAMVPNIQSLLDNIYLQLADRVHYAGVNAGSETFQPMPCLFDNTRLLGDSVLCLLLPPAINSHLAHGYPVPQHLMTATATTGNCISSIDWQPAFSTYREIIAREYGITHLDEQNFYQYACHFPFGILRAGNDFVIRIPVALTDDGSLFCVGEVPANAMLVLLKAPQADQSNGIQQLITAIPPTTQAAPLLTFYCAGRRMHLGETARSELSQLHAGTGQRPLFGALSLGEIGTINAGDYPCFHNATLVTLSV